MDLIETHHLIDQVMAPEIPDEESETHDQRVQQLRALGYAIRWEPLYDAAGASVAKRIGLFAHEGDRPLLIRERYYWRGHIEFTPWSEISYEQACTYKRRDGTMMHDRLVTSLTHGQTADRRAMTYATAEEIATIGLQAGFTPAEVLQLTQGNLNT